MHNRLWYKLNVHVHVMPNGVEGGVVYRLRSRKGTKLGHMSPLTTGSCMGVQLHLKGQVPGHPI